MIPSYHIKTSHLLSTVNQMTVFYMSTTLFNGLIYKKFAEKTKRYDSLHTKQNINSAIKLSGYLELLNSTAIFLLNLKHIYDFAKRAKQRYRLVAYVTEQTQIFSLTQLFPRSHLCHQFLLSNPLSPIETFLR